MPFSAIGGAISGISSLFGGNKSAQAATQASQAQVQAEEQAIQEQQRQFDLIQANFAPFLQAGQNALPGLANIDQQFAAQIGSGGLPFQFGGPAPTFYPLTAQTFQQGPGYQFQLQQGQNAVQNSAVGQTGTLSGNTLKALQGNATGLANQDWYNANNLNLANFAPQMQKYTATQNQQTLNNQVIWNMMNSLQNLVGAGQNAAGSLAAPAVTTGQGIASSLAGIGNAQASGIIGANNAQLGGINGLVSALSGLGGNTGSSSNSGLSNFFGSLFGGSSPGGGSSFGGDTAGGGGF
jgi:hypothetical protein